MTSKVYDNLWEKGKKIAAYSSVINLLTWDQETYMPKGAIDIRSTQISLLSSLVHKEQTNPSFSKNLFQLISEKSGKVQKKALSRFQKRSLELWREDTLKSKKLNSSFIASFSKATSQATNAWIKAKKENTFHTFAPHLKKIVDFCRQKADLLGYSDHPYDPLIDTFEPGMTTRMLDQIFSRLKKDLLSLLEKIEKKPAPSHQFLHQNFSHDKQLEISNALMDLLQIDNQYARLDESAHPFTLGIHPTDTRFTTWIKDKHLLASILGTLHESGHALYELNLPMQHYGTPICEATSIGMHESQSRFFETFVGKSLAFWKYFYPKLQTLFPKELGGISLQEFHKGMNLVKKSKIRVQADELTYCLHIILRYELEKQMIEGTLAVDDLPDAWAVQTKQLLHLSISSDAEGCLQDIHWSSGLFGYFPTYALGNLYAATFLEKLQQDLPDFEEKISQGSLETTIDWMKTHVHQQGRYYPPQKLLYKVTGKKIGADAYLQYLTKKFSSIYGV